MFVVLSLLAFLVASCLLASLSSVFLLKLRYAEREVTDIYDC